MKTTSQDFIDSEEAIQHCPLEIYELYNSSENYYWTSLDHNVTYSGSVYTPQPIQRGTIENDSTMGVNKLTIDLPYNQEALGDMVSSSPVEDYSLKITRLFENDLTEGIVLFIGEIESVAFKGPMLRATCASRHKILEAIVPRYRYQVECNWEVYSTKCGLNQNTYKTTTTATVTAGTNYTQLTSDDFDIADVDGIPYFRHGWLEYGNHKRTIIEHYEDTITIDYRIPGLTTTGEVNVYAGCDWTVRTCSAKFSNLNNFGGDPEIPINDCPTTWV